MQCVVPKEMHQNVNNGHLRVVGFQVTISFLLKGNRWQGGKEGKRKTRVVPTVCTSSPLILPSIRYNPALAGSLSPAFHPVSLKCSLPPTAMAPSSPLLPLWASLLSQLCEVTLLLPSFSSFSSGLCPQTFPFLNLTIFYMQIVSQASCTPTRHLYWYVPRVH